MTSTMRAYVLTRPGEGSVQDVPAPVAAPGEAVVDVARVGLCGTDVEFFTGEMAYLHSGHSSYPIRLGH
jgi:threonine dehydrogenase-like Zn-dependent dehydrogenase